MRRFRWQSPWRSLWRSLLGLVAASGLLTAGCKKADHFVDDFPAVGDGGWAPPVARVFVDGDVVFFPTDTGAKMDTAPADLAAAPGDAAAYDSARSGTRPDLAPDTAATAACSLGKQDCPGLTGCFRAAAARTVCQPPGGSPVGAGCSDDASCARGALCLDLLCRQICNVDTPNCGGRLRCQVLAAYAPIGLCEL